MIGTLVSIALLSLVTAVAFLLGRKAARGVEAFREEHHESFLGRHRR